MCSNSIRSSKLGTAWRRFSGEAPRRFDRLREERHSEIGSDRPYHARRWWTECVPTTPGVSGAKGRGAVRAAGLSGLLPGLHCRGIRMDLGVHDTNVVSPHSVVIPPSCVRVPALPAAAAKTLSGALLLVGSRVPGITTGGGGHQQRGGRGHHHAHRRQHPQRPPQRSRALQARPPSSHAYCTTNDTKRLSATTRSVIEPVHPTAWCPCPAAPQLATSGLAQRRYATNVGGHTSWPISRVRSLRRWRPCPTYVPHPQGPDQPRISDPAASWSAGFCR